MLNEDSGSGCESVVGEGLFTCPDRESEEEAEYAVMAVEFDGFLEGVGGWGWYQKRLWLMMTVFCEAIVGQNMIFMMFAGAAPSRLCVPFNQTDSNYTDGCEDQSRCKEFIYSEQLQSLATDFNLYCERAYLADVISSIQMAGVLAGALFWGQLAEIYGRKKVLLAIYTISSFSGIAGSFAPNWYSFAIAIALSGGASGGFWCVNYVLVQEVVGAKNRLFASCYNGWPLSISMFSLLTWLLPIWHRDLLIINCVGLIGFVFFIWVEESPRWLLQLGRMAEFEAVMTRIAKINGTKVPCLSEAKMLAEEIALANKKTKKYTYRHLFRTPTMTKHILALAASWFVVSFVGYALAFNVKNLPGNRYLNGFFTGITGAVFIWVVPFISRWVGRRVLHQSSLLAASICCGVVLVFQIAGLSTYAQETVITVFAILGASSLGPTWTVVYLYSAELFPTLVRNLSNGLCSVAARIGGIVAPLLLILVNEWLPLPFLIFTLVILLNLVLAFVALPETKDRPLPDILPPKAPLFSRSKAIPLAEPL